MNGFDENYGNGSLVLGIRSIVLGDRSVEALRHEKKITWPADRQSYF
jgi:hypothetical protein